LIIAAIAIPDLLRARIAANESSAAHSVRILNTAEVTCQVARFVGGRHDGYVFELTGLSPDPSGGANVKYQLVAYAAGFNQTGVRAFCSDETSVIELDAAGSARGLERGEILN
jgi:hypothetical protein